MSESSAVEVAHVSFCYKNRAALREVSLTIGAGEIFALLGPNGGGKTTLFRLISTLLPLQTGEIFVCGQPVRRQGQAVREALGVVFQSPSVDKKLTVAECLHHYGHLFGMWGAELRTAAWHALNRLGLAERAAERVETLSGGLRRRVELAQALLHRPRVLLMDEPSTGLDPAARSDLWNYLRQLRQEQGTTIVLTTHLLEEAEKADRLGILDQGRLVALDSPEALRASLGGDTIAISSPDAPALAVAIQERFGLAAKIIDGSLRLQQPDGHRWVSQLVEAFPNRVSGISVGKPTLEDVFIARTGHRFWNSGEGPAPRA
jgi:ABC-2 type transport system ATP-binding protein